MLDLSRVTLLFVETRAHEITKRVIEDCLIKAKFGDVVVFTDDVAKIGVKGVRYLPCVDFPNKVEAGRFYYSKAMEKVTTDFALMLEWDGGIFDEKKWKPEFFDYDYIGAPWTVRPGDPNDVGNGGFTLMSKRLGYFLCEHVQQYRAVTDVDVCRRVRGQLEQFGFKWPNRQLASLFSWELGPRNPDHFGYHGAFNWPTVLPRYEVVERVRIMLKSPYLINKLRDLFRSAPWLYQELTVEELATYHATIPPSHVLRPRVPGMISQQQRAAMMLAQRRGIITVHTNKGLKA